MQSVALFVFVLKIKLCAEKVISLCSFVYEHCALRTLRFVPKGTQGLW